MLRLDGVSLNSAATVSFLTFLATQITDLVGFFDSRSERTQGEIVLDENSNLGVVNPEPMEQQPVGASTPHTPHVGTSFGSWNFPDSYSTPVVGPNPSPPISGVCDK